MGTGSALLLPADDGIHLGEYCSHVRRAELVNEEDSTADLVERGPDDETPCAIRDPEPVVEVMRFHHVDIEILASGVQPIEDCCAHRVVFSGWTSGAVVSGFNDGGPLSVAAGPAVGSGAGDRFGVGVAGVAGPL